MADYDNALSSGFSSSSSVASWTTAGYPWSCCFLCNAALWLQLLLRRHPDGRAGLVPDHLLYLCIDLIRRVSRNNSCKSKEDTFGQQSHTEIFLGFLQVSYLTNGENSGAVFFLFTQWRKEIQPLLKLAPVCIDVWIENSNRAIPVKYSPNSCSTLSALSYVFLAWSSVIRLFHSLYAIATSALSSTSSKHHTTRQFLFLLLDSQLF